MKALKQIVNIMIGNVAKLLKIQGIKLEVDDKAKELVIKKGTNNEYGARPLKRAIQNMIEDKIAEAMLDGKVKNTVKVRAESDEIKVS